METIANIHVHLVREMISRGRLEEALEILSEYFKKQADAEHLNTVLLIQSELAEIKKAQIQGLLTDTEYLVKKVRINGRVLSFLDEVFPAQANHGIEYKPVNHEGKLLHNIPKVMRIGEKPVICCIRIASDANQLVEDLEDDNNVQIIRLNRIGENMGVELEAIDPEAFYIRPLNADLQQSVESDTFTEWVFEVTPIKVGNHTLVLKVNIILDQYGVKPPKNRVLTLNVEVSAVKSTAKPIWSPALNFVPENTIWNLISRTPAPLRKTGRLALNLFQYALVIAAMLVPGHLNNYRTHIPQSWPGRPSGQSIEVFIHAVQDSIVKQFSISHATVGNIVRNDSLRFWKTRAIINKDTSCYNIYYEGNLLKGRWEMDHLPDPLHLFVDSSAPDPPKNHCYIIVETDTVVEQASNWKLIVYDEKYRRQLFDARPVSDFKYVVNIENICTQLYDPDRLYYFSFVNDRLLPDTLIASPLKGKPAGLKFTYRKTHVEAYAFCEARLFFNQPIQFKEVLVNGAKIRRVHQGDNARLVNDISFRLYLSMQNPNKFTIKVNGTNCDCKPLLKTLPPALPSGITKCINDLITCEYRKTRISLEFGKKWLNHLTDLEVALYNDNKYHIVAEDITADKLDSQKRYWFPLTRYETSQSRNLCIRFRKGERSNEILELACRTIPLKDQSIHLKLTDNNQLVEVPQ